MEPLSETDLLLVIYVLVDDWLRAKEKTAQGRRAHHDWERWAGRRGPRIGSQGLAPSELLTLLVAIDLMDFDSERRFVAHLRANHAGLFSAPIPDHSWFNRCGRRMGLALERMRADLAAQMGALECEAFVIDTTPVEVVGYNRYKGRSDFPGSANYGYCASLKKHYFGYKLVVLSTLDGLPASCEIVPASTDERAAAQTVLPFLQSPDRLHARRNLGLAREDAVEALVFGDKGFIGEDWALEQLELHGAAIVTPRRRNQHFQWPKHIANMINRTRQRIETVNSMLKNGARNVGKTLAKTVQGLSSRLAARFAALTLRLWLKKFWSVDTANLLWDPAAL